ncbi:MAG TPA: SpoIIE family protein phosphatase [Spirochaetota bacterium]|nr:SpoIIE family protein phosphatase [Spirochaetota bacterium]HOT19559.1 SpoIIE family protein phosphatase [Spirochaetota bacterium]HPD05551.1 SpoIIE family protein phosphatase [Spirochaetota bacterium]HRR61318.1 SpoIIE family protein phosphatase [Spirochaetota bacterium]HRV15842.1 SpoIIE family protein phosphatase [Spirochaetota bacterium]
MNFIKLIIFIISSLLLFSTVALSLDGNNNYVFSLSEEIMSLPKYWYFRAEDREQYKEKNYDHSSWDIHAINQPWHTQKEFRNYTGNIWYRIVFNCDLCNSNNYKGDFALLVPIHYRGAQFYLNGVLVKETRPFIKGISIPNLGKPDIIIFPHNLVTKENNVIAIRISSFDYNSGFEGMIKIGTFPKISKVFVQNNLFYGLLIGINLFLSLYFILLFYYRNKERFYLYFAGMAFSFALWTTGYIGIIFWIIDNRIAYLILAYCGSVSIVIFAILFIHSFLSLRHNIFSKLLIAALVFFLIYCTIEIILTGLVVTYRMYLFRIFLLTCLIYMLYTTILCLYAIKIKRPHALKILAGIIVAYLFIFASVLTWLHIIDFTPSSIEPFMAMIFVFAFVLASRYAQVFSELEKAHSKLLVLDKMKDDFLATTSHELKTPLHGIMGIVETIMDGSSGPVTEKQIQNLALIRDEASHLNKMVIDILDFSKLRAGKVDLFLEHILVDQVAATIVSLLTPEANKKGLSLTLKSSGPCAIVADRNRLRQIIINLVGNAIKFSDKGTITVNVESSKEDVTITVSDEGPGIDDSDRERIWNPFIQAESPDNRHYGGTGLGLPITKYLVELHDGSIHVESEKGKGTYFIVRLPKQPKTRGITKTKQIEVKNDSLVLPYEISPSSVEQDEELAKIPFYKKAKILVVDDDEVNRKVIEGFCAIAGYELILAQDGPTALELMEKHNIDLVLLDLMLPEMSGYEVCQKLRQSEKFVNIPIIIVTARDSASDMVRGFVTGANDYITKPFTRSELLIRIENQLAIKQMLELERSIMHELNKEVEFNRGLYQRSIELKQMATQILAWERVIKEDMEVAKVFQKRLMACPAHIPGLNFHFLYHPLAGLSGDVYDIIQLTPDIIRIFIADATGHGITASLNTIKILSEYSSVKETMHASQDLLKFLNQRFIQLFKDYGIVFTCLIADIHLNEGKLSLVSAGHPPACVISDGKVNFIKPHGPIIGLSSNYQYQPTTIPFKKKDTVLLYTDGLPEFIYAQNKNFQDSSKNEYDKLKEIIEGHNTIESLENLCTSLMEGVSNRSNTFINDDITIIAFQKDLGL